MAHPRKMTMKEIIKEEYKKCAKEPAYFMKKYCLIQHPTRGKVNFILYPFQEDVLGNFQEHRYNIILKSRQLGLSTLSAGYIAWLMTFFDDRKVLVIATNQDQAKNLVSKVRVMYQGLPSWLKVPAVEDNKLSLRLKNGSEIKAVSSSPTAGRSEALSLLVLDEAAFIKSIDEIWGSAQQTLATGGKCIVLSTPNGVGNWFHKQWQKAVEQEKNPDMNEVFHPTRLHWTAHPERGEQWRKEQDDILGPRLAAQECFDANTRIYTNRGLKKISDVSAGDYVLTHRGRFKKVIKTYSHIDDNLMEIYSYNNRNKRYVTKNHPFLDINNRWIELKNVSNGQILKSFPIIDFKFSNSVFTLDLYEHFKPKYFDKILKSESKFYVNDRKHKTIHNRFIKMDYDSGYLIGLYLAEGSKNRLRTVFSFNDEMEKNTWPVRLQKIIENKFGLKNYTIRYKGSNTSDLEISSEVLSSFIDLFVDGNKCHNKKLTEFTYNFNNKEFYAGILDGVFRGDGCLTNASNKKIGVTSQNLIYDMKYISSLLGYNLSSIRIVDKEYKKEYHKKTSWHDKNYNYHNIYILSFYKTKNINIENEFSIDFSEQSENYSYRTSVLKNKETIDSKIYIKDSDAVLPVYNLEVEDDNSYVTEHFIVHNCDADFLSSGDNVIDPAIIKFYEETYIRDPLEKRYIDGNLWVFEYPDRHKDYIVVADVARGDASDYSAAHVFDLETMTQVAEYKGKIDTKAYGDLLVVIATEYNNALLVIERENIGWATIQQVLDRDYSNLFYASKDLKYVDTSMRRHFQKEKELVPGFSTSTKTRPLVIAKIDEYFRDKSVIIRSRRTVDEMWVFVWINGKAQAMKGYNDDLMMACGIALWVRDTALRLRQEGIELTKMALKRIRKSPHELIYQNKPHNQDPYNWNVGKEETEDLRKWLKM